jgi:hypothetical protein
MDTKLYKASLRAGEEVSDNELGQDKYRRIIPANATGYKIRMRFGKWWFYLFNKDGKNLYEYGPVKFAEIEKEQAMFKELGLSWIEKELGDKGK